MKASRTLLQMENTPSGSPRGNVSKVEKMTDSPDGRPRKALKIETTKCYLDGSSRGDASQLGKTWETTASEDWVYDITGKSLVKKCTDFMPPGEHVKVAEQTGITRLGGDWRQKRLAAVGSRAIIPLSSNGAGYHNQINGSESFPPLPPPALPLDADIWHTMVEDTKHRPMQELFRQVVSPTFRNRAESVGMPLRWVLKIIFLLDGLYRPAAIREAFLGLNQAIILPGMPQQRHVSLISRKIDRTGDTYWAILGLTQIDANSLTEDGHNCFCYC